MELKDVCRGAGVGVREDIRKKHGERNAEHTSFAHLIHFYSSSGLFSRQLDQARFANLTSAQCEA